MSVPVWVIGNLTVGGTGKTALVMYLANMLKQQGLRPGIISRGYGGHVSSKPRLVSHSDSVEAVGDEALLIVTKTTCPMVVCRDRVLAATTLLRHHDCDVLISDDGLQHLALQRDLEVVVVDDKRCFGNGWCFPAGPLREPAKRADTVDAVVLNGTSERSALWMHRCYTKISRLNQPDLCRSIEDFCDTEIQLLTAIGDPERLCSDLQRNGLKIKQKVFFKDHHRFRDGDLQALLPGLPVFVTEKDAVKMFNINTNHEIWVLKEKIVLSVPLVHLFEKYCAMLKVIQ